MSVLSMICAELWQYLFPSFGNWVPGKPELVERFFWLLEIPIYELLDV